MGTICRSTVVPLAVDKRMPSRLKWTGCDPHVQQPWGCFPIDLSFPRGYYHFYGRKISFPIRCATKAEIARVAECVSRAISNPEVLVSMLFKYLAIH